jgi:hypothetical protein
MTKKDHNPKEPFETYENVLFTKIIVSDLRATKLIDLAPALMIISYQQDLDIFFTDLGMMCANAKHYKKACEILENSVLYN